MNTTLLPDILHHTPAGASSHTLLHYAQEKPTGGFHGYDWGSDRDNYQHHNGPVPEYDLGDVKTPVALYWSDHDYFAMPEVTTVMYKVILLYFLLGYTPHHHRPAQHCPWDEP